MLVVRAGSCACAIPLAHVIETMRPLPIEALAEMPASVLGVSIIRGEPVPVVDLAALVGAERGRPPARFVALRVEARRVALAVDDVEGVRVLDEASFDGMPLLLQRAAKDVVDAIAPLDERLLLVLRAARMIPERE